MISEATFTNRDASADLLSFSDGLFHSNHACTQAAFASLQDYIKAAQLSYQPSGGEALTTYQCSARAVSGFVISLEALIPIGSVCS